MSIANTPASCFTRSTIQPRRCSKHWPLCTSAPQRYARRTHREITWYQGVSDNEMRVERARVIHRSIAPAISGMCHYGTVVSGEEVRTRTCGIKLCRVELRGLELRDTRAY